MTFAKTHFASLFLFTAAIGITAAAQDQGVLTTPKTLSVDAASGTQRRGEYSLRDGDTVVFFGDSTTAARTYPRPYRFTIRRARMSREVGRTNVKPSKRRSNANDGKMNRVASLSASKRDSALDALPRINSFRDNRSDRFLVDLDVVRTGHPYKGKNSKRPHAGGHVYFKPLARQLAVDVFGLAVSPLS